MRSKKENNYFLGSIVLIKKEGVPYSEVIDGQQRKLKGLTQKQLANMLGVSSPSIRLYELGKRTPSEDILRRMRPSSARPCSVCSTTASSRA